MSKKSYFIHETAVVDNGARIGNGTKVWHFSHLMPNCIIGENCSLGQNVYVASHVSLGNNVKVQNNVSIYEGVVCEDDVFLGPSMVFTNVINPRSAVIRKNEFKKTLVKKGATIGANATILCGIEIGEFAFIGAGAVVTKNIIAYALVTGNPAKQTGWMSEAGHKLVFNSTGIAICLESNQQYKLENGAVTKL
ncbi:MAG: N-acetyltransferase [Bacteroidetes bacterium]|nr:N-acetyltransferase [Bacteroidota bacterium]